jgi:hypothetical protein
MKTLNNITKLVTIVIMPMLARTAFAQGTPFTLIESHERTIPKAQFESIEAAQPKLQVSDNALILAGSADTIVVRTGPDDDMLSYRIQGLRNPTLVVHAGATVQILFANVDDDMPHDMRFGGVLIPDTAGTVGTTRQLYSENDQYSAEEITIRALMPGYYPYFCSYRDHAVKGMRGWMVVTQAGATMDEMMHASMSVAMSGVGGKMNMSGILLTEPMAQEGSGTSWQPASSPEYMAMQQAGDWMLMLHGDIMPRYDWQGGPRGSHRFDAPNWFMGMAEHNVGMDGQFTAHLMMSLDPLTIGGQGYPLLLQTGETWHGAKLVDAQHPHDLFDEVSVAYSQKLSDKSSAYVYLGYPGEPALGPPVFMHRPSAMSNPNAPIGHHWEDATHITFGVATAGISLGNWKLEGSYFNGSEPDENRYDFDTLKLNSYSGRLSFNPTKDIALQVSSGLIKNPEGDGIDVVRTTASAIYTKQYANMNWWSTTAVWGLNHEVNGQSMDALLLESQYNWKSWSAYGRAEYVQKSNGELVLAQDPNKINDVEAVTLGFTRNLFRTAGMDFDLGAQGTLNFVPPSLAPLYTEHPAAYEVYFSIHPSLASLNM